MENLNQTRLGSPPLRCRQDRFPPATRVPQVRVIISAIDRHGTRRREEEEETRGRVGPTSGVRVGCDKGGSGGFGAVEPPEPAGAGRETPLPLLGKRAAIELRGFGDRDREVGPAGAWPSHNSDSPMRQRPILMGEKCELPRFSGLILYDENGKLCDPCSNVTSNKEKVAAKVVRTTLRDLL